jgi:uncharacterized protein
VRPLTPWKRRGSGTAAEPVTVTVARVVRPDRRQAFERWAEDAPARGQRFPGNLGATLLRPGARSSEYHLRTASPTTTRSPGWERSPERRLMLAQLQEMVAAGGSRC